MTFLSKTTVATLQALELASARGHIRQLTGTWLRLAADNKSSEECGRGATKQPTLTSDKSKILKEKTPAGKLEEQGSGVRHPYQEKEPLPEHPGGVNPETGEVGGPRGPEPTRYGDWERKGRVTDF